MSKLGDTMMSAEDIMSTPEVFRIPEEYRDYTDT